ncbi:hypothetical protein CPB85DRAFT_1396885 [Mucidula mucida]|nr:hypothetical protein CPB85DRAFT_1396885 [Mucidula mucida]
MSLPTTTKEYYFPQRGSFSNLKLRTSPVPKVNATEVLVKVRAVSLQYRDLMIATDNYPAPVTQNLVPCSDMAGEIVAIGEAVTGWKTGDRICANFTRDHVYGDIDGDISQTTLGGPVQGLLTQYRVLPAHSLVRIPKHLSYEEASTLPCAALTAYNALTGGQVKLKAGDTVLIMGTGGVSIFGLQFAVASGATVIATSSSDDKLKIATKLGAKHVINYNKTPAWDQEVLKLTGGRGVDHILEVGGPGTLEKSMTAIRFGGSINLIGVLASTANPLGNVEHIKFRASTLRGIFIGSVAQFKDMNRLLEANPETTRPVVDKVFSFDEVIQAYAYLQSQAHVGKVVIKV